MTTDAPIPRSLTDLATEALAVQDACNLEALAYTFQRVLADLERLGILGDARRSHPVVIAWVDKLASLAGVQDLAGVNAAEAFQALAEMAKGHDFHTADQVKALLRQGRKQEAVALQEAQHKRLEADVASGKQICLSDMLATGEAFVE